MTIKHTSGLHEPLAKPLVNLNYWYISSQYNTKAWTFEDKAIGPEAKAWTFEDKAIGPEAKASTFEDKAIGPQAKAFKHAARGEIKICSTSDRIGNKLNFYFFCFTIIYY